MRDPHPPGDPELAQWRQVNAAIEHAMGFSPDLTEHGFGAAWQAALEIS
jgi:hypothetical protein